MATKRMIDDEDSDAALPPVPEGGLLRVLPIVNRRGLHARASAKFVQTVERYDAVVTVTRSGETVGGRSIMGLLTLGAAQGTTIAVVVSGPDADASLQAITDLLANKFGEDESRRRQRLVLTSRCLQRLGPHADRSRRRRPAMPSAARRQTTA